MKKILFCLLIFLSSCVTTEQFKNQFKSQWDLVRASTSGGFPFSPKQNTVAEPVRENKAYLAPDTVSGVILAHKYRDRNWIKTAQLNELRIVGNDPDGKLALLTLEAYQLQKRRKYSKVLAKVEEIEKFRVEMDKNKVSFFQALEQNKSAGPISFLSSMQSATPTSGDTELIYTYLKDHMQKSDDLEVLTDGEYDEAIKSALHMDTMRMLTISNIGELQFVYDQNIKDIKKYFKNGAANRATAMMDDCVVLLEEVFYRKATPTPTYKSIAYRYHKKNPLYTEYEAETVVQKIHSDLNRIPANKFVKRNHDALNYYCFLLKNDFSKADQFMLNMEREYTKTPQGLLLLSMLHNNTYNYKERAYNKDPQEKIMMEKTANSNDAIGIIKSMRSISKDEMAFSTKDTYSPEAWKILLGHYKKTVSFYKMSEIEMEGYEMELAVLAKKFSQGYNDKKISYDDYTDSYKLAGESIYGKDYIEEYF